MINLDELVLRVRSPAAREDIREAIACYQSGAHRAAVVMAWTAVVYDIMAKLRELELAGDKNAGKKVAHYESIRSGNDLKRSQDWERDILDLARDEFELLTHQEHTDLDRLRADRHRCAHPAMNTADEAYRPPPELVRYHLRSVLVHLLTQAPVQGKAAFARLTGDVKSSLFPADPDRALEILKAGPLQRPKDALLRGFVIATIKAILVGPDRSDTGYSRRLRAALIATEAMHSAKVSGIFADQVPVLLRSVPDADLPRIVILGDYVEGIWTHMPSDVRVKLEEFVKTADFATFARIILRAAGRPEMRRVAVGRIEEADRDELRELVARDAELAAKETAVVRRAVQLLEESGSWDNSNYLIEHVLRPTVNGIGVDEFCDIAAAAADRVDVKLACRTPGLLSAIRAAGVIPPERFDEMAKAAGLELSVAGEGEDETSELPF